MEIIDRLIQLMHINEIAFYETHNVEEEIAEVATECFGTKFSLRDVSFEDSPFLFNKIILKTDKELSSKQLSHFCYRIGFQLLEIEAHSSLILSDSATTTYKYIFHSNYIRNHHINRDTKWELKINK